MKTKVTISVGSVILLLLIVVGCLVRQRGATPSGISLNYLGSDAYPGGATARFLTSNRTELAALVYLTSVDVCSNGVWVERREQAVLPKRLLPHETRELSMRAPSGVDKWRIRVMAAEEKRGWASIVPRVKSFFGQAKNFFRDGIRFPTGRIYDGDELVSQVITTK